jgi:hypothetical protein
MLIPFFYRNKGRLDSDSQHTPLWSLDEALKMPSPRLLAVYPWDDDGALVLYTLRMVMALLRA